MIIITTDDMNVYSAWGGNQFREVGSEAGGPLKSVVNVNLSFALKPRRTRQQLSQHIRQNPAVQVVINLNRRVDAESQQNVFR